MIQGRKILAPEKLKIGFKKQRNNPIDLSFIVYLDENGGIKKEKSWNNWRDKSIDPIELDNKPISGFILSDTIKRSSDWFGSGRNVWRVTHPNGFEFEITSNNLEAIISNCDIIKGEIKGKCVFAWEGVSMSLVPINSELYQQVILYTENSKKEVIKISEVEIGDVVQFTEGSKATFLGKFQFQIEKEFSHQIGKEYNCVIKSKKVTHYLFKLENNKIIIDNTSKIIEVLKNHDPITEEEIDNLLYSDQAEFTWNHTWNKRLIFKTRLKTKEFIDSFEIKKETTFVKETANFEEFTKYIHTKKNYYLNCPTTTETGEICVKKINSWHFTHITKDNFEKFKNGISLTSHEQYYYNLIQEFFGKDIYSIQFIYKNYKISI